MRKKSLLLLLVAFTLNVAAQETETKYLQDIDKESELKLNAFNLIGLSALDVTYEKLVNANSSYGVSVFYSFSDQEDDIVSLKKYSVTPFYRWFFSETRFARGFFVEGFGMLNGHTDNDFVFDQNTNTSTVVKRNSTGFALGISAGGKFVTKQGFVTEVYLGLGRNLIRSENNGEFYDLDLDVVGRFGISLGYRF